MIRYSDPIPPFNRFNGSRWSKRRRVTRSARIQCRFYIKTCRTLRRSFLIPLIPSFSRLTIMILSIQIVIVREYRLRLLASSLAIAADRDTCLARAYEPFLFFYSCFRQTELSPRVRTTSYIFGTVYNALVRTTSTRNVQTGILPRRATLDILTTILGISRYGYRYCTLYVSSSLGKGKTRQEGGEREREVRYVPRYVCLEVVSHE